MSDFSFSATAECELCGGYLSSSDEDCDHDGFPVKTHVFRRLTGNRDTLTGVESTSTYKWERLQEKLDDDWIAYQYLGTRENVESMLSSGYWRGVEDLPAIEISTDA